MHEPQEYIVNPSRKSMLIFERKPIILVLQPFLDDDLKIIGQKKAAKHQAYKRNAR